MRVKIIFTNPNTDVPINNQFLVNSFIHNQLGRNNKYHDTPSNYCVSPICGGKLNEDKKTLSFIKSPFIIVSSSDNEFMNKIINALFSKPELGLGMKVENMIFINESFNDGWNHFNTLSPILLKESYEHNKSKFITVNDPSFEIKLRNQILRKLSKVIPELNSSSLELIIQKENQKVKKIYIKNVSNLASVVRLSIKTTKEIAEVLYNMGIGQSTGSGFGTIYKPENYELYNFN